MAEPKRINLALQGGGAHGAFTWGVLDRLLEEEDIEIAGISGTSAGALNGAAFKAGIISGGRDGAKANLEWLWTRMGANQAPGFGQWMSWMAPGKIARAIENSPAYIWGDTLSRLTSPYAYGPFYRNPLRSIVEEFNYDKVCADTGPQLFICATRVRTGKIRVFSGDQIGADAILASACLPTLFQAVEIDDPDTGRREAYWDGGYSGNPAIYPLFRTSLPDDVVVVNINPLERDAIPVTPQQIQNRINEISFNASLLREMRAIAFVQRMIKEGRFKPGERARVLMHMIADDDLMNDLSVATKSVPHPVVLDSLKEAGRAAAHGFLVRHKGDIGVCDSIDLEQLYG